MSSSPGLTTGRLPRPGGGGGALYSGDVRVLGMGGGEGRGGDIARGDMPTYIL